MKVLHVYKDYHPVRGGVENYMKVLAEAQASAGHEVTVLACDPGLRTTVEEINGVRVVKAGRLATVASMPISLSQPIALTRSRAPSPHSRSSPRCREVRTTRTRLRR